MAGRVENLKPFPKGVSGNPGGRPKTAHISEALRRALENGEAEHLASILLALATGKKRGSNVQIAALREIADRTEGKARQSIEVDADFSATLAERIAEARKRVYAMRQSQCREEPGQSGRGLDFAEALVQKGPAVTYTP